MRVGVPRDDKDGSPGMSALVTGHSRDPPFCPLCEDKARGQLCTSRARGARPRRPLISAPSLQSHDKLVSELFCCGHRSEDTVWEFTQWNCGELKGK